MALDDILYDAINLFKYSPTVLDNPRIGGDAAYKQRYRRLAKDVVTKLWSLRSRNEIGFDDFGGNTLLVGNSDAGRPGYDIRANSVIEPSSDATIYGQEAEQGKLAAFSCNIVHEATHLIRPLVYLESELLCRTIQLFYFQDLKLGLSYRSRVTGTQLTAKFTRTTNYYRDYMSRLNRLASHDLIDSVYRIREYRRDLEERDTANFILRSLPWWGGLNRRWPSTRGYYLRSLAAQAPADFARDILKILESIPRNKWSAAKSCAGSMEQIRRGLNTEHHLYDIPFSRRVQRVQVTLSENFGMDPRP